VTRLAVFSRVEAVDVLHLSANKAFDMDLLEQDQRRATKMIGGLAVILCFYELPLSPHSQIGEIVSDQADGILAGLLDP